MFTANVIGNLGADVEVKDANGKKFASFRVADSYSFTDENGNKREVTNWIDCTLQNVESPILPYLKAGTKVFVSGRLQLRVYSSQKDRCMKAGAQVFVNQIELCGGNTDAVPRQIINPEDATIHEVTKHYWTDPSGFSVPTGGQAVVMDARMHRYLINEAGFITPEPVQAQAAESDVQSAEDAGQPAAEATQTQLQGKKESNKTSRKK